MEDELLRKPRNHGPQRCSMNYSMRLAKAFEGTKFDSIPDYNDAYPIIDLGKRNIREFEALSDERKDIILGLLSEIFATVIQPAAIEKYGSADGPAVESIVHDRVHFRQTMEKLGLDKQIRKEYVSLGLTEENATALQESLTSFWATEFEQLIVDLVDKWRLFPIAQTQSMAKALADMMKEFGA